jgi:2-oxoglutarate ferredoxin oxidoreductase subunit beta
LHPEVVTLGEQGITEADILRHDEHEPEPNLAFVLSRLDYPDFPVPVGVFRAIEKPTYDQMLEDQRTAALARHGEGDLEALFNSGDTWVVEE